MRVSKVAAALLVGLSPLAVSAEEPITEGQKLYEANCASCHQFDGGGVPMLQPELIDRPRANGPKGGVIDMILFGSDAMAENEGDYGNEMPSFSTLSDTEIALIATYVRTNFENSGGPVTAADVRARRGE